ncbi:MAG TPA: hypothetical protein ENN20_11525 [Candidatus Marinimicrobia bacterium]|nr:hypothetical protein [Candidatus Neomarinimicrobiota bacterium]
MRNILWINWLLTVLLVTLTSSCNRSFIKLDVQNIALLDSTELAEKIHTDAHLILFIEQNINQIHHRAEYYFAPFQMAKPVILTGSQRREIKEIWILYLDHLLGLTEIMLEYRNYQKIAPSQRDSAFLVGYSAYLLLYSTGLYFLENSAFITPFEILLDEPIPECNLPKNLYSQFKWHILKLPEITNINVSYNRYLRLKERSSGDSGLSDYRFLFPVIESNYAATVEIINTKRMSLLLANYLDTIKDGSLKLVFPLQKGVALFMAHTRFTNRRDGFITKEQCRQFTELAEPGDIILERGEWRMTNLGIPGFWPHSALYLGNLQKLTEWSRDSIITGFYQKKDPECRDFRHYLERHYPNAFSAYLAGDMGEDNSIIEGLKEGIIFHSVIGSVGLADHAACLRPRLSKLAKARAIETAFQYWGRGYDYSFSLLSDNELVCSELIYKSYEPTATKEGLNFLTSEIARIVTLPANNIAAQFDREYGTDPAQLDFVLYYACDVRRGKSRLADVHVFRGSHKKPRWSFYLFSQ